MLSSSMACEVVSAAACTYILQQKLKNQSTRILIHEFLNHRKETSLNSASYDHNSRSEFLHINQRLKVAENSEIKTTTTFSFISSLSFESTVSTKNKRPFQGRKGKNYIGLVKVRKGKEKIEKAMKKVLLAKN